MVIQLYMELKTKSYDRCDDFIFQIANFQHHQLMVFTFRNSYVILRAVLSTLIFWTENVWSKTT